MRKFSKIACAGIILVACAGSGFANAAGVDPSRAIAAFQQACLSSAPAYGDWKATFKAAGIASLNRNKLGMPSTFPAGDAITDPKIVSKNIGGPVVADCAVVIAGDAGNQAKRSIKSYLASGAFPLKSKSDMSYTPPNSREKVVFQKAYSVNGMNFHVLVETKDSKEFGLLTTLNASLIRDVK